MLDIGITGLSQLLAGRSARYSRRLERLYLRRQSFSFDLRLIALSFVVNLVGKRVVRPLAAVREVTWQALRYCIECACG